MLRSVECFSIALLLISNRILADKRRNSYGMDSETDTRKESLRKYLSTSSEEGHYVSSSDHRRTMESSIYFNGFHEDYYDSYGLRDDFSYRSESYEAFLDLETTSSPHSSPSTSSSTPLPLTTSPNFSSPMSPIVHSLSPPTTSSSSLSPSLPSFRPPSSSSTRPSSPSPTSTTATKSPQWPTVSTTTEMPHELHQSIRWLLEQERRRHPLHDEHVPSPLLDVWFYRHILNQQFCAEAKHQDDPPLHVTDGSFHPKYEMVPGVGVYRFYSTPLPWDEARGVCEREGAQLAIINSHHEARKLTELHNRCPQILDTHFDDYQYLGVHDAYSEGKWETTSGVSLAETGYVKWGFGQPDNAHQNGEDCLALNRYGTFNDVPCWTKLPFTCEHP